jgi:hypothetical protein
VEPQVKDTYKLTYILLALVMVVGTTLAFSGTTLRGRAQNQQDQATWKAREEEKKKHFPTAEFNEVEPADPLTR